MGIYQNIKFNLKWIISLLKSLKVRSGTSNKKPIHAINWQCIFAYKIPKKSSEVLIENFGFYFGRIIFYNNFHPFNIRYQTTKRIYYLFYFALSCYIISRNLINCMDSECNNWNNIISNMLWLLIANLATIFQIMINKSNCVFLLLSHYCFQFSLLLLLLWALSLLIWVLSCKLHKIYQQTK